MIKKILKNPQHINIMQGKIPIQREIEKKEIKPIHIKYWHKDKNQKREIIDSKENFIRIKPNEFQ